MRGDRQDKAIQNEVCAVRNSLDNSSHASIYHLFFCLCRSGLLISTIHCVHGKTVIYKCFETD